MLNDVVSGSENQRLVDLRVIRQRFRLFAAGQPAVARTARHKREDFRNCGSAQFLLAPPWVMKPFSKNRFDIKVYNDEVLFELLTTGNDVAVLIENEAVTVED